MSKSVAEPYHAALALSDDERSELAEMLELSVKREPGKLHPDRDAELRRRFADYEAGKIEAITLKESRRRIRERFDVEGTADV